MVEEASKKTEVPAEEPVMAPPAIAAKARKPKVIPPGKAVPDVNLPAENEKNKVIHIVRRLHEEANQKRARRRKPWLMISFLACILLPGLVASLYFFGFAANQYVSQASFAVRSNDTQTADVLGMMTGMPGTTITSDSYIVTDYIRSREMVEELERRLSLRKIYDNPEADFLTRLDPGVSLEGLVKYWNKRIDVFFDSTKATVSVTVQAFTPEDAQTIAREIVEITRRLVNELSAQARRDAVQFAASELARAELRVRGARADMLQFRIKHNEFDPSITAESTLGIVSSMESKRSEFKTQLAALSGYLADNAPSVQMLKSRIAALDTEIARVQGQISHGSDSNGAEAGDASNGADSGALASVVALYQELTLNQEFAEKAYAAALASMERARVEADRTQSYLALYLTPNLAEEAAYPRRVLSIMIVLIFAAILWAVGALGVLTVRDHMP
jgi:capsular polysaccharide transport system permease protein